jgi:hypothetical protein
MATSIQLAQDLSAVLGIPTPTVMHILDGLRSDGLIVARGRGPSATAMSNTDASALLIGIGSGAAAAHVGPAARPHRRGPPDSDHLPERGVTRLP